MGRRPAQEAVLSYLISSHLISSYLILSHDECVDNHDYDDTDDDTDFDTDDDNDHSYTVAGAAPDAGAAPIQPR